MTRDVKRVGMLGTCNVVLNEERIPYSIGSNLARGERNHRNLVRSKSTAICCI